MEKLILNVVTDSNLNRGLSFEPGKIPTKIEYIVGQRNFDGITLFTDKVFDDEHIHIIDEINSKYKVAWMHEPRALGDWCVRRYKSLEKNLNKFYTVATYDEYLLDTYPQKTMFCPDNGIWIQDSNIKIHPKTKLVSMIYSYKNWTEGHRIRHAIADQNVEGLDLYGDGSKHPVEFKEEALADYQFSITIENSRAKYYYTEKLLDCLACGTVPIYWGCKNIGNFFDERGIIQFTDPGELVNIFYKLIEPGYYESLMPFIKTNFELALNYKRYEDQIYETVYRKILGI